MSDEFCITQTPEAGDRMKRLQPRGLEEQSRLVQGRSPVQPPPGFDLQTPCPSPSLFAAGARLKAAGEKLCSLGHRPTDRLLKTEVGAGSDPQSIPQAGPHLPGHFD